MTTHRMAPMRFGASAGFTMPSMIPIAVRISEIIVNDPKMLAQACMRLDADIV
jgi:hypothetical protein